MAGSPCRTGRCVATAAHCPRDPLTPVAHLLHKGAPRPCSGVMSAAGQGEAARGAVTEWMADPLPPEAARALPGWGDELARCGGFSPTTLGHTPLLAILPEQGGGPVPQGQGARAPSEACSAPSRAARPPVIVCGPCTSSLDVGHALADAGALPEWGAVLAVSQRAGRGQLRRPWDSPPGNIYAAWRLPAAGVFATAAAAMALGCMFAESFAALGISVHLKWPNDLLLDNAKIGGMLIEERRGVVLAGIGINLATAPPAEALRQGWAVPAACLAGRGIFATPLTLWRHLVDGALFCYETHGLRAGGADFISCAERYLAWVGRGVVVHGGNVDDSPGRILGLDPQGGLRIAVTGREHILRSGSITPIPS